MRTEGGDTPTLLRELVVGLDWQKEALCIEQNDRFMPTFKPDAEEMKELQRICFGCPVNNDCREMALDHGAYGMHAGKWHVITDLLKKPRIQKIKVRGYKRKEER